MCQLLTAWLWHVYSICYGRSLNLLIVPSHLCDCSVWLCIIPYSIKQCIFLMEKYVCAISINLDYERFQEKCPRSDIMQNQQFKIKWKVKNNKLLCLCEEDESTSFTNVGSLYWLVNCIGMIPHKSNDIIPAKQEFLEFIWPIMWVLCSLLTPLYKGKHVSYSQYYRTLLANDSLTCFSSF